MTVKCGISRHDSATLAAISSRKRRGGADGCRRRGAWRRVPRLLRSLARGGGRAGSGGAAGALAAGGAVSGRGSAAALTPARIGARRRRVRARPVPRCPSRTWTIAAPTGDDRTRPRPGAARACPATGLTTSIVALSVSISATGSSTATVVARLLEPADDERLLHRDRRPRGSMICGHQSRLAVLGGSEAAKASISAPPARTPNSSS